MGRENPEVAADKYDELVSVHGLEFLSVHLPCAVFAAGLQF
jgi:hypothetical protein